MQGLPCWNAETGTWRGDRARVQNPAQALPDPLRVFGYGSLCWKPESEFAGGAEFHAYLPGYRRLFAQRSTDHRGTVEAPGFVLTAVRAEDVPALPGEEKEGEEKEEKEQQQQQEQQPQQHAEKQQEGEGRAREHRVHGVVWKLDADASQEYREHVLDVLDFREKAGYTRVIVDVFPVARVRSEDGGVDTVLPPETPPVQCILYTGKPDNPNFDHRPLAEVARVIASSVGPSGPNWEYCYHIARYLERIGRIEPELQALDNMVRQLLGGTYPVPELPAPQPTGRTAARSISTEHVDYGEVISVGDEATWHRLGSVSFWGMGSNQYGQLACPAAPAAVGDSSRVLDSDSSDIVIRPHQRSVFLYEHASSAATAHIDDNKEVEQQAQAVPAGLHTNRMLAGGAHSAILTPNGQLFLWGDNHYGQIGVSKQAFATLDAALELRGVRVRDAALGHTHTVILDAEGKVSAFGADKHGQCSGAATPNVVPGDQRVVPEVLQECVCVAVAAGVRHSAAITADGALATWGYNRDGEVVDGMWRPPMSSTAETARKVVQVACGRRHTVVLDSAGVVWTCGSNRYGQLGRDMAPDASGSSGTLEPIGLPVETSQEDHVVAIASGWSHTVVLTRSGAVFGFGRNTFGQLPLEARTSSPSADDCVRAPRQLAPTPTLPPPSSSPVPPSPVSSIVAIQTFSEGTFVQSADGQWFAAGWGEHGNLGTGDVADAHRWTPVCIDDDARLHGLTLTSTFSLTLGGAHSMLMTAAPPIMTAPNQPANGA